MERCILAGLIALYVFLLFVFFYLFGLFFDFFLDELRSYFK